MLYKVVIVWTNGEHWDADEKFTAEKVAELLEHLTQNELGWTLEIEPIYEKDQSVLN